MTLRDFHDRCIACGRRPSEACCDHCHRGHDTAAGPPNSCKVEDCGREHYARGYCQPHHQRWLENDGDAYPDVPIGYPGQPVKTRRVDA